MPQNIWEIFDANPGSGPLNEAGQPKIGHKAVSAALAAGHKIGDIKEALSSPLGIARTAESNRPDSGGGVHHDLGQTGPTSMWGVHDTAEARGEFVGAADINFMTQQGVSDTDMYEHISEHGLKNPEGGVEYMKAHKDIKTGADLATAEAKIGELGGKYTTLEGEYQNLSDKYGTLQSAYDAMGDKYTGLQKDVAQAAKDALKIKYTGSTGVRNPSAMGIQAAQGTPFRGSGLAGTAALARPNRGMKIKTLNV